MKNILSTLMMICFLNAGAQQFFGQTILGSIDPWNIQQNSKPGSVLQLNSGNILFTAPITDSNKVYNVYAAGGFYPPQTPQISNSIPIILKHMADDRYFAVNFKSQVNFTQYDTIKICRFLPDGTYDSSFKNIGIYTIPIYNDTPAMYIFHPYDLVVLKDSSLILTYAEEDSVTQNVHVKALKLKPDGNPDNTFGTNGIIILSLDYVEKPVQTNAYITLLNIPILEDNDHHIYFGGRKNNYKCLIRYSDAGIFDSLYGYKIADLGDISRLILDYSGDILAIGSNYTYINWFTVTEWFVRKYKPDGSLNTGFGVNGESVVSGFYLNNGFLQPDGKIVLFGQDGPFPYQDNVLGIRLHADGTLDNSWLLYLQFQQCDQYFLPQMFVYTSFMAVPGQLIYAVAINDFCFENKLHLNSVPLDLCGNGNAMSSQPVLSANNLNLCQGAVDTIFIAGNLNAASYWEYYTNLNPVPQQVYGNSFTVSPNINTIYYVRGAGYCSGNGPVDSIVINVIPTTASNTNTSICINQVPYSFGALSIDSPGVYTIVLTGANGCDSLATLYLNISLCGLCQPDYTVNWTPFTDSLVESQTWITTSGTVLIPLGAKVKFDANTGGYVRLNPGFKAEYGSVFVAQAYNGCTAGAPQLPQAGKKMNSDLFQSNEIILYPNPTTGMIHIQHDEKLTDIQIFDMVGKLIINQQCERETETNIDLSNLPNGVYHVKAVGYNSIKVIKND